MSDIGMLPDVDSAILALCEEFMAGTILPANIRTVAPTPGADPLPAAQLYTFDGDATQIDGYAVFDAHFFATKFAQASLMARTFDRNIMRYPHRVEGAPAVLLDVVETISIPTEVEWVGDNSARRFKATYSVSFRRR
jgi:hypothetical protein